MQFEFDSFGPEKIISVYNSKTNMKGFVVIDNTVLGPGKGGIRMTPFVNEIEVVRLARAMTLKNALAEIPFGGAKAGIIADSKKMSLKEKNSIVKSFALAIKEISPLIYIGAPDMNMTQKEMDLISKTLNSKKVVTGKSKKLGGIPHEIGTTGYGVAIATEIAVEHLKKKLNEISFAVEGFGSVGFFATKFLVEKGAKLVSVSDSSGCVNDENGIDFEKLVEIKKKTGSVINYNDKSKMVCSGIISSNVDVLITAAIPDLITRSNFSKVKASIIVEGSNIPMSYEVEEILYKKNVLIVPDIIANAGGVISSYVEHINGSEKKAFELIEKKISKNTKLILNESKRLNLSPRNIALKIAQERILKKQK